MDISILHQQYFHSDDEISASIRSVYLKQRQVFDFIHSWAKESKTEKFKKARGTQTFYLFLSGSVAVGKSYLIKALYQSLSKLLQYHGGSPAKP